MIKIHRFRGNAIKDIFFPQNLMVPNIERESFIDLFGFLKGRITHTTQGEGKGKEEEEKVRERESKRAMSSIHCFTPQVLWPGLDQTKARSPKLQQRLPCVQQVPNTWTIICHLPRHICKEVRSEAEQLGLTGAL